jgi:hypothetical protein
LIIGLTFVLQPSNVVTWLQKITPSKKGNLSYSRYAIIIVGLILLALIPLDGTWAKCSVLCSFFGK